MQNVFARRHHSGIDFMYVFISPRREQWECLIPISLPAPGGVPDTAGCSDGAAGQLRHLLQRERNQL